MGTFNTNRFFFVSPALTDSIVNDLVTDMEKEGYQVEKQRLITGAYDISLTKGDIFKAIVGMQTALKVIINPQTDKINVEASVGIFGQQVVPTVISMLLFWPILIPQIWGLVQQSKLDDRVMEIIESSIEKQSKQLSGPANPNVTKPCYCINCGNKINDETVFCENCGHKL